MAREKSEKKKREETEKSLKKSLEARGLSSQVYLDKVEEYMSFYDDYKSLNKYVNSMSMGAEIGFKNYTDAIGEKRRITNEMRRILLFLGMKPEPESGGGPPEKL